MQQNTNLKIQTTVEKEFNSLEVTYEAEHNLAWYRMNAYPRPCFTFDLLNDIQVWFKDIKQESRYENLGYIVMGSSISGSFNLGGDLELFCDLIKSGNRAKLLEYAIACIKPLYQIHTGLGRGLTTISLVQGDALGGGFEVAISSDILIAERSAKMGMPEVLFNLFPGMGAYSFLTRKLGEVKARNMILGGKLYSAKEMFDLGLVDVLAEDGEGEQAVYNYIKKENRAKNGYSAFRQAQRCYNPVTYEELEAITTIWVDAALNITSKDLRMMERLVKRQSAKVG